MDNRNKPIGIFDSGVGGLTVFKEVRRIFPNDDIIYFGDTARVPYGPKSRHTVVDYCIQNLRFLLHKNVKVVVVACNTASAVALETLQTMTDIPVVGVVEAGAKAAINASKNYKIGVIGTEGTVNSKAYSNAILKLSHLNKKITSPMVIEKACPLLVPLVEEGWFDGYITSEILKTYLSDLIEHEIDTLILGCTHYPIMKKAIKNVCGKKITLIDSAEIVSEYLKTIISSCNINKNGDDFFYVSDNENKFNHIAKNILGIEGFFLKKVKLAELWFET